MKHPGRRLGAYALFMAATLPVSPLHAQDRALDLNSRPAASALLAVPRPVGSGPEALALVTGTIPATIVPQTGAQGVSPGRAAALSVLIPGAGQHVLDQRRKWGYLALEALGWILYADRRGAGAELRRAYRDFAWSEARLQSGARVDGDWQYYETLTHWARSGHYDADPTTGGVQPESDPATYNGSIWALATQLFLPGGPGTPTDDPSYQRALAYYAQRGYNTAFLWDWTGRGGAQSAYVDLISATDRRYRQATNVLGALIANHALAAADAYLSARGLPTPAETRVVRRGTEMGTHWYAWVAFGVGG
jgi:hypothetical protein